MIVNSPPILNKKETDLEIFQWFTNSIKTHIVNENIVDYYSIKLQIPFDVCVYIKSDYAVLEIEENIFPEHWKSSFEIEKQYNKFHKYDLWKEKDYKFNFEPSNCILYFPDNFLSESILQRYLYVMSFLGEIYFSKITDDSKDYWT